MRRAAAEFISALCVDENILPQAEISKWWIARLKS